MKAKNFKMFEDMVENRIFSALEKGDIEMLDQPFKVTMCGITIEIPCTANYYEYLMGALEKVAQDEEEIK